MTTSPVAVILNEPSLVKKGVSIAFSLTTGKKPNPVIAKSKAPLVVFRDP